MQVLLTSSMAFLTRSTLLDVICNGTGCGVSTWEVWIANVGIVLRDCAVGGGIQKQAANSESKSKMETKRLM